MMGMERKIMTIRIPPAFEGRLLRSYLTHTLSLSSGTLARLKARERGITVNGRHVTVRYVLHAGDLLELDDADTPEEATRTVLPVPGPLYILYEDDSLIILNKPAGMPTHPSHGHLTDTLANALAYRYAQSGTPFVFRPLGRLDRNTSGVVAVSKTYAVSGFLGQALVRHEISKRYLAVLEGRLPVDGLVHTIEVPILPPAVGTVMRTACDPDTPGSEYALTRYRVLAVGGSHTLVLAEPCTGRTHQLRVHFAHLHHPLVGDELYGGQKEASGSPLIRRHALHALSLSLPLPFLRASGKEDGRIPTDHLDPSVPLNLPSADGYLHTWAPLPADMEALIKKEIFGSADGFEGSPLPSGAFAGGDSPTVGQLRQLTSPLLGL